MSQSTRHLLAPAAIVAAGLFSHAAQAVTQSVTLNVLNATATVPTPLLVGDNLHLDTLVTSATGALSQTINFTVGSFVSGVSGEAVWEISTAGGTGPRLTGVDISIFDSTDTLVASDTLLGAMGGFAVSNLASSIGPGTYKMVATGTAVRDSVLDVTLSFVPEPHTYAMMFAGLGVMGLLARRRQR